MARPFHSEKVLTENISEATLKAYHVGFDQNKFRLQPLVDIIMDVLPEFSLGYFESKKIASTEMVSKLREAARRVYLTDNYKLRGEFGELILHLLLRDFHETIPLISKIYFKDAHNATVHGFDGIHITNENGIKKLWLGESKLYNTAESGVDALVEDLENHLQADYLRSEFELIKSKLPENTPDVEYWRGFMNPYNRLDVIFQSIVIPMVCTYSSNLFKTYTEETAAYFEDFTKEIQRLKLRFESKKQKIVTNVEVLLLLLPIPCKDLLNTELDKRLKGLQGNV